MAFLLFRGGPKTRAPNMGYTIFPGPTWLIVRWTKYGKGWGGGKGGKGTSFNWTIKADVDHRIDFKSEELIGEYQTMKQCLIAAQKDCDKTVRKHSK